jgi:hypothetical protein
MQNEFFMLRILEKMQVESATVSGSDPDPKPIEK